MVFWYLFLQALITYFRLFGFAILSLVVLSSCATGFLFGVSSISAYSFSRDKYVDTSVYDIKSYLAIRSKIKSTDSSGLLSQVNIKVNNGTVYYTGMVVDKKTKEFFTEIASDVKGIVRVVNDIEVIAKPLALKSFGVYISDSMITSQARILMLFKRNIRSMNYHVNTFNGVVYITGNSVSENEILSVSETVSHTIGVRKVTNYSDLIDEYGDIKSKPTNKQSTNLEYSNKTSESDESNEEI